ncbi:MAG: PD40 domain-containing protein [Dehalococcoidales bacterium]|nr:PD40 domain-containing protein [Dehalococcoidales bacterium]
MKKTLVLAGTLLLSLLFLLAGCTADKGEATERIVFSAYRNDIKGRYIYSMNTTGGDITRLARAVSVGHLRDMLSDNGRLVYIEGEYRDPGDRLSIMDIDGENREFLLDISGIIVDHFTPSPDGEKVLLACRAAGKREKPGGMRPEGMGNDTEFYMLDTGTGILEQITDLPEINKIGASFSPNGKKIAFIGRTDTPETRYDLYIMDSDGENLKKMTDHEGGLFPYDRSPLWSPNGKQLVYAIYNLHISDSESMKDIFLLDLRTGKESNLTNSAKDTESEPDWSPDGKKIAFTSTSHQKENTADYGAYIMNADGSNIAIQQERLTQPCWLPDGKRLLGVHRLADREYALVIYDLEEKTLDTIMTHGEGYEYGAIFYPQWVTYEDEQ